MLESAIIVELDLGVYVCGLGKLTLTSKRTSSIIHVNSLPLMSCLKFTLTALRHNTTCKRLWVDNIAHCRASLFGKRSQRSLFSTVQIRRGLNNAGSPKEGRFC